VRWPLHHWPICHFGHQVLLKAAAAAGSIDSYVEKFMWEDGIDIQKVSSGQVTKLKRYLELFSGL